MYKYFMGKHSNLKNRTEKLPIVIEIDELASRLLNFWLDKYCLDFDRFVEGAKIILKDEIEKIMYESQDGLALYLENGRTCFLILMNDDVPRCTLHVNNDEFTLNLKSENIIENCYEETENVRYGIDFASNPKKISVGNSESLLTIRYQENGEGLYEKVKENIEKLEVWDDLADIISWLKTMQPNLSTFAVTSCIINENTKLLVRLDVYENEIEKYAIIDSEEEFLIESNGCWITKNNDFVIRYDIFTQKISLSFVNIKLDDYDFIEEVLKKYIELIVVMFKTTEILNKILVEFSKK